MNVAAGWVGLAAELDSSPDSYVELHTALDEPTTDAFCDARTRAVRDEVRRIAAQDLAPRAAELDRTGEFAGESYLRLARAGLAGLLFDPSLGGSGDTTITYAVAMEEITAACPATSLVYMTQTHAAYPIALAGAPELARRIVPHLLDGTSYGSLAITEPDAGSDVSTLRTSATRDGSAYRVTGAKTFITTGDRADVIVCFATTDRSAGRGAVSAFVIEGKPDGLERGAPLRKLGMTGSSTAQLYLDRVRVPVANRLGGEGTGWSLVMQSVIRSRISAAAQGVGLARGAYAYTLAALDRIHSARLPAETAYALAGIRARIALARLALYSTAALADGASPPSAATIAIAKERCTQTGFAVALECLRLLGPYGDRRELRVEQFVRDAQVTRVYDGTNEIQRLLIARDTRRRIDGDLA